MKLLIKKIRHRSAEGIIRPFYVAARVRAVLKRDLQQAGITKNASLHTRRHRNALPLSLLKNGLGIRLIYELTGHNSSKTKEIHTPLANDSLQWINPLLMIGSKTHLMKNKEPHKVHISNHRWYAMGTFFADINELHTI